MSEEPSEYKAAFVDYANSPELLYEKSKNELERVEGYAHYGRPI